MSESDRELSSIDRLVETEDKTNDDGTVMVTIDSWEEMDSGHIRVYYITPTGEQKSDKMSFPQPGGDLEEYKFYRLIRGAGLSMRNADLLEGEPARAERSSRNGWHLVVEETETTTDRAKSLYERTSDRIAQADILGTTVTLVWIVTVISITIMSAYALL